MFYKLFSGVAYTLELELTSFNAITNLKTISKVEILTNRNSSERLGKALIWAQSSLIIERLPTHQSCLETDFEVSIPSSEL